MTEQQSATVAAVTVDRLARIETKLDNMAEDRADSKSELAAHSTRLDRVERFMWLAVGMSFASGVPSVIRALGAAGAGS